MSLESSRSETGRRWNLRYGVLAAALVAISLLLSGCHWWWPFESPPNPTTTPAPSPAPSPVPARDCTHVYYGKEAQIYLGPFKHVPIEHASLKVTVPRAEPDGDNTTGCCQAIFNLHLLPVREQVSDMPGADATQAFCNTCATSPNAELSQAATGCPTRINETLNASKTNESRRLTGTEDNMYASEAYSDCWSESTNNVTFLNRSVSVKSVFNIRWTDLKNSSSQPCCASLQPLLRHLYFGEVSGFELQAFCQNCKGAYNTGVGLAAYRQCGGAVGWRPVATTATTTTSTSTTTTTTTVSFEPKPQTAFLMLVLCTASACASAITILFCALMKKKWFACKHRDEEHEKRLALIPRLTVVECIGLVEELDKHSRKLDRQMRGLANDYKGVLRDTLGEKRNTPENRFERLKELFEKEVPYKENLDRAELALRRFVLGKEGFNSSAPAWKILSEHRCKIYLFASMVFVAQTCGMVLVMIYVAHMRKSCYNVSLTNFMAVFVVSMYLISRFIELNKYSANSQKDAHASTPLLDSFAKRKRVTGNSWWTRLGKLDFFISTFLALVTANIAIWRTSEVLDTVAYAGIILVLYHLGETTMKVFVVDPDLFRSWLVEASKQMEYCPDVIEDLTKKECDCDAEIWRFEINDDGKLARHGSSGAPEPCLSTHKMPDEVPGTCMQFVAPILFHATFFFPLVIVVFAPEFCSSHADIIRMTLHRGPFRGS